MNEWSGLWWTTMVCINVVSFLVGLAIFRHSAKLPAQEHSIYLAKMRFLGLVFISIALYRSIFVSSYLEQLAWFDSLANSSLFIRFLAFFAELSFAGLFALAMLQFNRELPRKPHDKMGGIRDLLLTKSPYILFGCIFLAQFFATTATITKFEVLFAIEETLWGLAFVSIFPLAINQLQRVFSTDNDFPRERIRMYRVLTIMITLWCGIYCAYSLLYHLPIELWPHVIRDLQAGNTEFRTGVSAVKDAFLVVNSTRDYSEWGGVGFFVWHSGYFSICVWMVLFLMSGPRLLPVPNHSNSR